MSGAARGDARRPRIATEHAPLQIFAPCSARASPESCARALGRGLCYFEQRISTNAALCKTLGRAFLSEDGMISSIVKTTAGSAFHWPPPRRVTTLEAARRPGSRRMPAQKTPSLRRGPRAPAPKKV